MRSKLKLNLDQLAVDSFDTQTEEAQKGTVFGEQCTCWTNCTCPGCPSCDPSCNGSCQGQHTCGNSCYGTCGDTCNYSCNWWECGTVNDATCQNYGTCHYNSPCQIVP